MKPVAELSPRETGLRCGQVLDEIETVLVGGRKPVELVLLAILSGGHTLIEGLPGVGKTLLARCLRGGARVGLHPDPVHARPAAR